MKGGYASVCPPVAADTHWTCTACGEENRIGRVKCNNCGKTAEKACSRGAGCTDFSDDHRRKYLHPEGILMACAYGSKCYRRSLEHLRQYVHPGDRNYRYGRVHYPVFKGKQLQPEFVTVRDLFNYCDPDESGNISKDEFGQAWNHVQSLAATHFSSGEPLSDTCEDHWQLATAGQDLSHVTFAQFAKWSTSIGIQLPMGVDFQEDAERPCRFEIFLDSTTQRCPCTKFTSSDGLLCECGHKSSAHLSDAALMTVEEQEVLRRLAGRRSMARSGTLGQIVVRPRAPGFDMVTDRKTLEDLQELLTQTHKTENNWTRDRGCSLHGRCGCSMDCAFSHKVPVPRGYQLVRAEKNRNEALWQTYCITRSGIREECRIQKGTHELYSTLSSTVSVTGSEELDSQINEWRLFHGTGLAACKGICGTNFRLKLAGTGATWKKGGESAGLPLYGWGVYLAERSTKGDEYAEEITGGLPIDEGCFAMLVCRVVGGACRYVDTNEFDPEDLRRDVFDGPYHSVYGDRETTLGKPFKEIVVYNNNQIFPEYILYYKRF